MLQEGTRDSTQKNETCHQSPPKKAFLKATTVLEFTIIYLLRHYMYTHTPHTHAYTDQGTLLTGYEIVGGASWLISDHFTICKEDEICSHSKINSWVVSFMGTIIHMHPVHPPIMHAHARTHTQTHAIMHTPSSLVLLPCVCVSPHCRPCYSSSQTADEHVHDIPSRSGMGASGV